MGKTRTLLTMSARFINEAISFLVFCFLDLVDFLLCFLFKSVDMLFDSEFRPCYCSSAKEAITSSGKILVSEQGESKIVSLSSTKLMLEDISDTLYSRPSLVSEVSRLTMNELKRLKLEDPVLAQSKRGNNSRCSSFTVNTTIVEMLQGKIGKHDVNNQIPRWSDCDCKECCSWIQPSKTTLYVKSQFPTSGKILYYIIVHKVLY